MNICRELEIYSKATFADFEKVRHRYSLERIWDSEKPLLLYIGLNPSTSDELTTDQTVNYMLGYAMSKKYGGLLVGNIFSVITPSPKNMKTHKKPTSLKNDEILLEMAIRSHQIIIGWGIHGTHQNRDKEVLKLLSSQKLFCFSRNKNNTPTHPRYKFINKSKLKTSEYSVL